MLSLYLRNTLFYFNLLITRDLKNTPAIKCIWINLYSYNLAVYIILSIFALLVLSYLFILLEMILHQFHMLTVQLKNLIKKANYCIFPYTLYCLIMLTLLTLSMTIIDYVEMHYSFNMQLNICCKVTVYTVIIFCFLCKCWYAWRFIEYWWFLFHYLTLFLCNQYIIHTYIKKQTYNINKI